MYLHEYQSKNILQKYGIKIPNGLLINNKLEILNTIDKLNFEKYVIKAQIHMSNRKQFGGILIANSKQQANIFANSMFNKIIKINEHYEKIQNVYIEEYHKIKKEYYISLSIDNKNNSINLLISNNGGSNIEFNYDSKKILIHRIMINPLIGIEKFQIESIINKIKVNNKNTEKKFIDIIINIYQTFININANQLEINPIALDNKNELIALDAKIILDDNTLYKHKNILSIHKKTLEEFLESRARSIGINFIKMQGNIGCIVNGAGLAMATMDLIKLNGLYPANFLDISGKADSNTISETLELMHLDNTIDIILINIFGGIICCKEIATGIIQFLSKKYIKQYKYLVRLAGTNYNQGIEMLKNFDTKIILVDDITKAIEIAKNLK